MSEEYTKGYRDGVLKTLQTLRKDGIIGEEEEKKYLTALLRVRKVKERKGKRPTMALRKGKSYFVDEKGPHMGIRIFSNAVKHQAGGLCVMRMKYAGHLKELGMEDVEGVDFIWLTQSENLKSGGMGGLLIGRNIPTGNKISLGDRAMILTRIKAGIKNEGKRVIYFEGLDAMIYGTKFDDIMKFLQQITETVSMHRAVAIFSIDLQRLNEQQRAAIEGELEKIEIRT